MNTEGDWLIVGIFGRVHGVKGFISIHSYTEPPDNILQYPDWHGFIHKAWQPLRIQNVQVTNKQLLAQVEGFESREQVAELTQVPIAIRKETLPKLPIGEFYWHQLIGMTVMTPEGEDLGQVTEILPTGSNDVLIVEGRQRHLIPFLPGETIVEVNLSKNQIMVAWDLDF